MTAALHLPSYGHTSRDDLVLEVARLGLALDDASHHQGAADAARTQARFHHAMAMLLAVAEAEQTDPQARERIEALWEKHERLVEEYKAELAKLEGRDT